MSSRQPSNTVGSTKKPLAECAVRTRSPPATMRAPSALAALDVAEHHVHVLLRDQRADMRRGIERVADAHRLDTRAARRLEEAGRTHLRCTKTRVPFEQTSPAE